MISLRDLRERPRRALSGHSEHTLSPGLIVDWLALDILSDQVTDALSRRALRGVFLRPFGSNQLMDAECVARIILADIDHVREWERTRPAEASDFRRHGLAVEVKVLLLHVRPSGADPC